MDRSELVESEKPNINQSSEAKKGITRRRFMKLAAVTAAVAAVAAAPEVVKKFIGVENSKDDIPTYEELVSSVRQVYRDAGKEMPDLIGQRLKDCNEKNLSPEAWDVVRTVTDSCGEVGAAVRDLYRANKKEEFKVVLGKIEVYTFNKIDQFVAEGRYPDPAQIDSLKSGFKENYFTP